MIARRATLYTSLWRTNREMSKRINGLQLRAIKPQMLIWTLESSTYRQWILRSTRILKIKVCPRTMVRMKLMSLRTCLYKYLRSRHYPHNRNCPLVFLLKVPWKVKLLLLVKDSNWRNPPTKVVSARWHWRSRPNWKLAWPKSRWRKHINRLSPPGVKFQSLWWSTDLR